MPRVRSMSMNFWVGGFGGYGGGLSGSDWTTYGGNVWRIYLRTSEMLDHRRPKLSSSSTCDPTASTSDSFAPNMTGWPDQPGSVGFPPTCPVFNTATPAALSFADMRSKSNAGRTSAHAAHRPGRRNQRLVSIASSPTCSGSRTIRRGGFDDFATPLRLAFRRDACLHCFVSRVEEIERIIEQLPRKTLKKDYLGCATSGTAGQFNARSLRNLKRRFAITLRS